MENSKHSNYENSYLGSIVIIRNLIFNQNKKNENQVDHAWRAGRPCVIIYTDNEYDYFLPLSSTIAEKKYYADIKYKFFELSEDQFLYLKKGTKTSVISLESYFLKSISGYREIGKLTQESYIQLIKKFSDYHKESLENLAKIAIKK